MSKPELVTSTEYKIEKGIARPKFNSGRHLYPFNMMEVGDSIFDAGATPLTSRVAMAARSFGKHHDVKFSCRSVEGGTRIWRIA